MSNIVSIEHLHKDFKSVADWRDFAEKQLATIATLQSANAALQDELASLKRGQAILSPGQGARRRLDRIAPGDRDDAGADIDG